MTVQATQNPLYIKHYSKNTFHLGSGISIKAALWMDSHGRAEQLVLKNKTLDVEDCHVLKIYQGTPIDLVIIGTGLKQQQKSMSIGTYVQALGMRLEWATTSVAIDIWNICMYDSIAAVTLMMPSDDNG